MSDVPVMEHDEVALQERVPEVPAEECARLRRIRAHNVVRGTLWIAAAVGWALADEVARIDGEELAPYLESE